MQSIENLIVSSISTGLPVSVTYRKPTGVLRVGAIVAHSVERCKNGNTIVRATCQHTQEPRSFTFDNILCVRPGDVISNATFSQRDA